MNSNNKYWILYLGWRNAEDKYKLEEEFFHNIRTFSASHITLPVSWLRVHKELRGYTAGTASPNRPRDIPYHMVLCSAIKSGGRKRKTEGCSELWQFVFPSNHYA